MKTQILAIGKNEEILSVVVRLINQHEQWSGTGASTDEHAKALFSQHPFDIVLLCGGISEESEQDLRHFFLTQNPSVHIVQHYGGGSGLLENEIRAALDQKPS
jgi:hypothetical protein